MECIGCNSLGSGWECGASELEDRDLIELSFAPEVFSPIISWFKALASMNFSFVVEDVGLEAVVVLRCRGATLASRSMSLFSSISAFAMPCW